MKQGEARMLKQFLIKEGLSKRESEVAELVTKGLSNKEVADQLYVTEKTVKFHLTNIYKKMNLKSRAQLIVWCLPKMVFIEDKKAHQTQTQPSDIRPTTSSHTITDSTANVNDNTIPAGYKTVSDPETPPFDKGSSDLDSSF